MNNWDHDNEIMSQPTTLVGGLVVFLSAKEANLWTEYLNRLTIWDEFLFLEAKLRGAESQNKEDSLQQLSHKYTLAKKELYELSKTWLCKIKGERKQLLQD